MIISIPTIKDGYDKDYIISSKLSVFDSEWNITKSLLHNTRTCLDIGAHIGIYALEYSKYFENVHSFEPIPKIYEYLKTNTHYNSNINIYNTAISDKDDEYLQMLPHNRCTEINVVISEETDSYTKKRQWNGDNLIEVKSSTIDSYEFIDVDFIKIDTERYVFPVLKGMDKTLKNNNAILQIEIDTQKDDIIDLLKKYGYSACFSANREVWFTK